MYSSWKNRFDLAHSNGHAAVCWLLPNSEEPQYCESEHAYVWDFTGGDEVEFVFAPFNLNRFPALVIGRSQGESAAFQLTGPNTASPKSYKDLVARSVQVIQEGQFQKLVGARAEQMPLPEDPIGHFEKLCAKHPRAFRYILYTPQTGLWMGASPELLLNKKGNQLETVALAGTQKTLQEDWSTKEIEEQEFVVNYLKEVLEPWSDSLTVSAKETWHSGHLSHLINRYSAQLKDNTSLSALVKALHPTPAVAGLPKLEAIKFLEQSEGFERSYYSGFAGPVHQKEAAFYVNLRCLQILNDCYRYAGAGLTALSDPEKEWLETAEKMKVVNSLS